MRDWWNKIKGAVIVLGIVGIILALFLVPAFSRINYEISLGEQSIYSGKNKIMVFPDIIPEFGENLKIAFSKNLSDYMNALKTFLMIYMVLCAFILYKVLDKKEYDNIEHGSADWCRSTEAYSVLSPKEGLILAEKYYLPVIPEAPAGKNGNVLVIGGSRFAENQHHMQYLMHYKCWVHMYSQIQKVNYMIKQQEYLNKRVTTYM